MAHPALPSPMRNTARKRCLERADRSMEKMFSLEVYFRLNGKLPKRSEIEGGAINPLIAYGYSMRIS